MENIFARYKTDKERLAAFRALSEYNPNLESNIKTLQEGLSLTSFNTFCLNCESIDKAIAGVINEVNDDALEVFCLDSTRQVIIDFLKFRAANEECFPTFASLCVASLPEAERTFDNIQSKFIGFFTEYHSYSIGKRLSERIKERKIDDDGDSQADKKAALIARANNMGITIN